MSRSTHVHRVVALAYDSLCTFEFGIVVELFGLPRPELGVPWYDFRVCSLEAGPICAVGGVRMEASLGLSALRRADTIIIPGWRNSREAPPNKLIQALRFAHRRGARLVSICSGVFILAATGLLDGKRATTHWRYAELLASHFPKIHVEPDVLYVDEGSILTSAGSAAGIDLGLHIIRRDYGAKVANMVARRLVVPPHREGGQAQYVPNPIRADTRGGLAPLLQWVQSRLDRSLTVDELARKALMSPRTFARRFRQETGTTPHQWLTYQRLLNVQRLLETTDDSIGLIAERAGLGTAATLRQNFRKIRHISPGAYRRRFSTLQP
ncbi:MAG TPA: transcriptional regulator FtrA [Candidatus Sulfotelmatobacter sp.]|nr:transcriptional regulator FtrA [Candidatus Sulfotelmatobacter sp.]